MDGFSVGSIPLASLLKSNSPGLLDACGCTGKQAGTMHISEPVILYPR
uniref:Uncharacterized protein n=1 Tax=Anguilla anguilla TaxID=7936 RepID=A0A0E9VF55_ANGAN